MITAIGFIGFGLVVGILVERAYGAFNAQKVRYDERWAAYDRLDNMNQLFRLLESYRLREPHNLERAVEVSAADAEALMESYRKYMFPSYKKEV